MNTHFKTLSLNKAEQHILIVTLNRPDVRNAINFQMMNDLRDLWQGLRVNQEKIRCVILTGAGDKAFCAGADLKERHNMPLSVWREQRIALEQAMLTMLDCPVPIIAAVNGAAYGGGFELALASDFIYAAETAHFALSETKLGIMPGAMGTQNLPRAAGLRKAKELCFTAESFSAAQAAAWGIVNKICLPHALPAETLETAKKIAGNAPLAVQQSKKALNSSQHLDIRSGFQYEIEAYNRLLDTQDREEGIRAFNEKRAPSFSGD